MKVTRENEEIQKQGAQGGVEGSTAIPGRFAATRGLVKKTPVSDQELNRQFEDVTSTWSKWQKAKIPGVPFKYHHLYKKAATGNLGAKSAIKAFCQHCVGYRDVVTEVGNCTANGCPLWQMRPYQKKAEVTA
jgi:hypothetical protein